MLSYETRNPSEAAEETAAFLDAVREHRKIAGQVHGSLDVAKAELEAHAALSHGDWNRARALFEKASELERTQRYNEPPSYPRPVAEALGHIALRRGDTDTAKKAFRIALEQYPADWHASRPCRRCRRSRFAPDCEDCPHSRRWPAGCCAALAAAREGADVRITERSQFPRHKVCGEFLSPEIAPVLGSSRDPG